MKPTFAFLTLSLLALTSLSHAQLKLGEDVIKAGDVVVQGDVTLTSDADTVLTAVKISKGRVALSTAKQTGLNGAIAGKPFTVAVTLNGRVDGTALSIGPLNIGRKAGQWTLGAGKEQATLSPDFLLRLVVVADGSSLRAFANGRIAGTVSYQSKASGFLLGSPAADKSQWQGLISDLEVLPRSVMPQEAAEMSAAKVSEGRTAVIEAEVTQFTPVPEPASVLPYKHALITQEYVVKEIKSGSISGVKVGSKIRVARWGIRSGAKTAIKDLKKGSRVTLTLGLFADYPTMEREFTVDKLAEAFDLPYLLDIEKN